MTGTCFVAAINHELANRRLGEVVLLNKEPLGEAYRYLVRCNALVTINTTCHPVGVFRTCWCGSLGWHGDTVIELNSMAQLAVDNVRRCWRLTLYVTFGRISLVRVVALVFRAFVSQGMEAKLRDGPRHLRSKSI